MSTPTGYPGAWSKEHGTSRGRIDGAACSELLEDPTPISISPGLHLPIVGGECSKTWTIEVNRAIA